MAWTNPKTWAFQEGLTSANFNLHIRDNLLALGPHLVVRKTLDESVTSSTLLQNDDVLLMAVAANEIWHVQLCLSFSAVQATGDLKVAFTFPAGGEIGMTGPGADNTGTFNMSRFEGTTTPTTARSFSGPASSTARAFQVIEGIFINAGTAGNFQLQWAQAASNVTATIVRANSTLWAVKLA